MLVSAIAMLICQFAYAAPHNLSPHHRNAGIFHSRERPEENEFRERTLFTPAEFSPASELQMTIETFRRMERALVGTLDQSTDFVVLVRDENEGKSLSAGFTAKGGNASRIRAVPLRRDSFWYQDYGPIYSMDTQSALVSNDFSYTRYNRRNDDAVPENLSRAQGTRNRKVTMNFEGGNFISDGKGTCFASSRIYEQNPQLQQAEVDQLMAANLGCRKLVVLAPLLDDITYHIDLFAKLVNEQTFIVGDFPDHPGNNAIMDHNAAILEGLGYTVHRLIVRNPRPRSYLTHVNSFLVNGFVLLPNYGVPEDSAAAELYTRLGFKVLHVNTSDLANSGGAIHCILKSKPAL